MPEKINKNPVGVSASERPWFNFTAPVPAQPQVQAETAEPAESFNIIIPTEET